MQVIITDNDHADIDTERRILEEAGVPFRLEQCVTEDDVIERCADGEIFLNQYAPITRRVVEALPNLKLVVRYGVGVNNVDVEACTEHGVQVENVPDYGMNEVADQAIALMMALLRKVVLMNEYTKTEGWDYARSVPVHRLSELTCGVIGLGRIGREFAKRAHALGMKVIGYDPYFTPGEEFSFVEQVGLDDLMERSDVISVHCPPEHAMDMFNKDAFARMKDTAYLINVARGGIVNEADLDVALAEGQIAGAALDCMENEPVAPGNPLFAHENLLVTPHMAWYSEEAADELNTKVAEEAVAFAAGEPIRYPVNTLS